MAHDRKLGFKLPPIIKQPKQLKLFDQSSQVVAGFSNALMCTSRPNKKFQLVSSCSALCQNDSDSLSQKVSLWPSRSDGERRGRRSARENSRGFSKTPLALQIEAFIRKEHRQYLLEHPDCKRVDTLHIFREALTTFVEHFSEYKSVLNLIRDEYDLTINEMAEKMAEMEMTDLENRSACSIHMMELVQLKESLNATISNQEAQLRASQNILHALREQLAAQQHDNTCLKVEMESKLKDFKETQSQVKMLSRAMIEETNRTNQAMEASKKKDKEISLLNSRIIVLTSNISELEGYLRDHARVYSNRKKSLSEETDAAPVEESTKIIEATQDNSREDGSYSPDYVRGLLARIDELEAGLAKKLMGKDCSDVQPIMANASECAEVEAPVPCLQPQSSKNNDFPIIQEWLRLEGVGEAELEFSDTLLPPGLCMTEELAFLKARAPVQNRHLGLREVLKSLDGMWSARECQLSFSRLETFFMEWLMTKSGNSAEMRVLGLNLLHVCQRNRQHPECCTLLKVFRDFLPEKLVLSWRSLLRSLLRKCEVSERGVVDELPIEVLCSIIRSLWPEKSHAHMLQLRFYAHRHQSSPGSINFKAFLEPNSYFITLLKHQYAREVEEFTLRVVEGVRAAADISKGLIGSFTAARVMKELDKELTHEVIYTYLAEASQLSFLEVSSTDAPLRLDGILHRFRTAVLLRRATPVD